MRRVLNIAVRYLVVILFAFAVAAVIDMIVGVPAYRFWGLVAALTVICAVLYNFRWLLGLKRA